MGGNWENGEENFQVKNNFSGHGRRLEASPDFLNQLIEDENARYTGEDVGWAGVVEKSEEVLEPQNTERTEKLASAQKTEKLIPAGETEKDTSGGPENLAPARGSENLVPARGSENLAPTREKILDFNQLKKIDELILREAEKNQPKNEKEEALQKIEQIAPKYSVDGERIDREWQEIVMKIEKESIADPRQMAEQMYAMKYKFLLQRYGRRLGETK